MSLQVSCLRKWLQTVHKWAIHQSFYTNLELDFLVAYHLMSLEIRTQVHVYSVLLEYLDHVLPWSEPVAFLSIHFILSSLPLS